MRRINNRYLVAGVVAGGLVLGVVSWLQSENSLEGKASGIIRLPREAVISYVEEGEWAGDGIVEFTLPKVAQTGETMRVIWHMNNLPAPTSTSSGTFTLEFYDEYYELAYLGSGKFRYQAVLGK